LPAIVGDYQCIEIALTNTLQPQPEVVKALKFYIYHQQSHAVSLFPAESFLASFHYQKLGKINLRNFAVLNPRKFLHAELRSS
jgi:hypothetical protein